jgi:hypothetical protein
MIARKKPNPYVTTVYVISLSRGAIGYVVCNLGYPPFPGGILKIRLGKTNYGHVYLLP